MPNEGVSHAELLRLIQEAQRRDPPTGLPLDSSKLSSGFAWIQDRKVLHDSRGGWNKDGPIPGPAMPDEWVRPNPSWKEPEDGEIIGCGFRGDRLFRHHWDAKTKTIVETEVETLDKAKEGE